MFKNFNLIRNNVCSQKLNFQVSLPSYFTTNRSFFHINTLHKNNIKRNLSSPNCILNDTKKLKEYYYHHRIPTEEMKCYMVEDVLNIVNSNVPIQHHKTTLSEMEHYGPNIDVLISRILRNNKPSNSGSVLKDPSYFLNAQNGLWNCESVLKWPEPITFLGIGRSRHNAYYDSLLGIIIWLNWRFSSHVNQVSLEERIMMIRSGSVRRTVVAIPLRTRGIKKEEPAVKKTKKLSSPPKSKLKSKPDKHLSSYETKKTNKAIKKTVASKPAQKHVPMVNKLNLRHPLLQNASPQTKNRAFSTDAKDKTETTATPALEIVYEHNDRTKQTTKLYPHAKSALHNMFDLLASELKQRDLKLVPKYKLVKTPHAHWTCLYDLKWPSHIKCSADGFTKQEASHKAAVAALSWLLANQKMNKAAQPLVIDADKVKELHKETLPVLRLAEDVINHMDAIYGLHKSEFMPRLMEEADDLEKKETLQEKTILSPDIPALPSVYKQKYLSLQRYMAKEKVELPIAKYKNEFMALLKDNNVIVLKGEPGCGKSTRIPQYVLEAWAKEDGLTGKPCRIAVTQPRRIAAISLAERVSKERDEMVGSIVGFQVRLNNNFSHQTGRLLYCTTGILLRRLQADPTLSTFTHVILDEAHERDVNTDLLMNLLRTTLKKNPDLKVVVMSATIDTDMFQKYFEGAPAMVIPGFTHPVTQHFLDDCKMDVGATLKMCSSSSPSVVHEDVGRVIRYIHKSKDEGAVLVFLPGWDDILKVQRQIPLDSSLVVYCLHSRLQDHEQYRIFSRPPPGVRKIILATNIAETSVTIDDVVYVVDTGIYKDKRFDNEKGIACIDSHWISKASAIQRKGRAGRVKPGESFHLYTKAAYESFSDYSIPEILRTSLTKIVLDAKVYSGNMDALEFMGELPCPPEPVATLRAVEELQDLDLLDGSEKLTSLGKTLADFQLEPKLAKAMVNAVIYKCVTPVIDVVTLFSAETELFTTGLSDKDAIKNVKKQFCNSSDHLAMMRILEKWLEFVEENDTHMLNKFYRETELIPHKLSTVKKLRSIHFEYLYNGLYDVLPISDDYSDNDELVKAVLYSGIGTVLKHRNWDVVKNRVKNNVKVLLTRHNHKATITPESVNYKRTKYPSNYLLYMNETRSNVRRTTIIRESSLMSDLSVLLFSNKKIDMIDVKMDEMSSKLNSKEQVKLFIKGTNIEFLCDKAQAEKIVQCKEALNSIYRYYIDQMTCRGERNNEVNQYWDAVLSKLNDILLKINIC